jgi:hypothetical protein
VILARDLASCAIFLTVGSGTQSPSRFDCTRNTWGGDKALMHENFWDDDMNRDIYKDTVDGIVFPGYAKVSGSNTKLIEVATYLEEYLQDYENDKINEKRLIELEKKFKWLNKYVDISPLRKILEDFWKK